MSDLYSVYPIDANVSNTGDVVMSQVDASNAAFVYPFVYSLDSLVKLPGRVRIRAKSVLNEVSGCLTL